jgi:dipeptidase
MQAVDEPSPRYVQSCDTIVVFAGPPGRRRALFAKNSDRPGMESQALAQVPAQVHQPGASVTCQYVTVPQAPRTLGVLGSRPWWLWGFEHGVNEAGVAIGNEAIYTHDPVPDTGLLGMDLGLERGATAAEAKDVIAAHIERYGQGGVALAGLDRRYHNSFIVADPTEAWVIETSGRHWAARRTTSGAVISNLVTIEDDWDECSAGIEDYAREMGHWNAPPGTRFNFNAAFEDHESRAWSEQRYQVGRRLLAESAESAAEPDLARMMRYLRDHLSGGSINGRPEAGERTVCMHPSLVRRHTGSTAASMVVELAAGDLPPVAWTSMAAPCTGVFIPVTVGRRLPTELEAADERPDPDSVWWAMRELQYVADRNPLLLAPIAQAAWVPIEQRLLATGARLSSAELRQLTTEIMRHRDQLVRQLNVTQLESDHALVERARDAASAGNRQARNLFG